jgi:hypothetical protein
MMVFRVKSAITAIGRMLVAFGRNREGVAAVEFALLLPFLLVLYAGSVEISELITADRRVNTISGAVGDLVARSADQITEGELADYVSLAEAIIRPFPLDDLRQVITCVFIEEDGDTTVIWSSGFNEGIPYDDGAPYPGLAAGTSEMNAIARGEYVIVSEASYSYTPVFGFRMNEALQLTQDLTTINIYHENFHLTRFGDVINLVPS